MKNYRKNGNDGGVPICVSVSDKTGLPIDILGGYPQIRIVSGRKLIIEGSCRISEYTCEHLSVSCRGVEITVKGRGLDVKLMDETALVVCGVIRSVSFGE